MSRTPPNSFHEDENAIGNIMASRDSGSGDDSSGDGCVVVPLGILGSLIFAIARAKGLA